VSVQGADFELSCSKDEGDQFKVGSTGDIRISLQTKQNQYCSGADQTKQTIACNKAKQTNDELFTKTDNEDGSISFKCTSNEKFVTMSKSDKILKCDGAKPEDAEKFQVTVVDESKNPPAKDDSKTKGKLNYTRIQKIVACYEKFLLPQRKFFITYIIFWPFLVVFH
jgi:hypothetical protein